MTYLRNYRMVLETVECNSIEELIAEDIRKQTEIDGNAQYVSGYCKMGIYQIHKQRAGYVEECLIVYYPDTKEGRREWQHELLMFQNAHP